MNFMLDSTQPGLKNKYEGKITFMFFSIVLSPIILSFIYRLNYYHHSYVLTNITLRLRGLNLIADTQHTSILQISQNGHKILEYVAMLL